MADLRNLQGDQNVSATPPTTDCKACSAARVRPRHLPNVRPQLLLVGLLGLQGAKVRYVRQLRGVRPPESPCSCPWLAAAHCSTPRPPVAQGRTCSAILTTTKGEPQPMSWTRKGPGRSRANDLGGWAPCSPADGEPCRLNGRTNGRLDGRKRNFSAVTSTYGRLLPIQAPRQAARRPGTGCTWHTFAQPESLQVANL